MLVSDEAGEEVVSATYGHNQKGLGALCRMLVRMEVVLVAIERPDGLLVERLLDAGLRVGAASEQGRGRSRPVSVGPVRA